MRRLIINENLDPAAEGVVRTVEGEKSRKGPGLPVQGVGRGEKDTRRWGSPVATLAPSDAHSLGPNWVLNWL
jgi:hypothetical protein